MLTAALALGGFYFYVFVYTRWLKRSSPQNIVIGGAAGAFPPLVGWAAVTGRIDLLGGLSLPHHLLLDAAALLGARAQQAARLRQRAGVPMAPLVWGERETMRKMLWYTLILLPLTLLPVAFGALGIPYLVWRRLLGGWLLVGVIRVMRAERLREAGVVGVQVLAALPRAALRGDGGGPGGGVSGMPTRGSPLLMGPGHGEPGAPAADRRTRRARDGARAQLDVRRLERHAARARRNARDALLEWIEGTGARRPLAESIALRRCALWLRGTGAATH